MSVPLGHYALAGVPVGVWRRAGLNWPTLKCPFVSELMLCSVICCHGDLDLWAEREEVARSVKYNF